MTALLFDLWLLEDEHPHPHPAPRTPHPTPRSPQGQACCTLALHPPTPAGSFSLAQPRKGQDPLPSFSFPSPHCTYQPF